MAASPASDEIHRRKWESVLPREEIAELLSAGRLEDLIARLHEARARWPRDLELLRSIRVLELHVADHPSTGVRERVPEGEGKS